MHLPPERVTHRDAIVHTLIAGLGWLVLLGLALFASGCASADLAADRATYDAIAPEYADYVRRDPALTEDQRERRLRTLELWDARTAPREDN